ncbi:MULTISPECIES: hypothetical protein [unclassified Microcoleus]|uniref:hypothetical protein n=1 Tax=unclassified Microcoleus TaxID=2642155 RepID=UPI002FCEEC75
MEQAGKPVLENGARYEFKLSYLAAINRGEILHLLAARRKKSGETKKQWRRYALAFELFDESMIKFN